MKRHEIFFNFIRFPIDLCICIGSFFVARLLRENHDLLPFDVAYQTIGTSQLIVFAIVAAVIVTGGISISRLYQNEISTSKLKEVLGIGRVMLIAFFVYVGLVYFGNGFLYDTPIPRLLLILAFAIITVGILISRTILDWIQLWGLKHGYLSNRNILILLQGSTQFPIEQLLHSELYTVVGVLGDQYPDIQHLGSIGDLSIVARKHHINDVFCFSSELSYEEESEIIRCIKNLGIKYRYLSHLSEYNHQNADIQIIGDTPIVEIRSTCITLWGRVHKRIFDVLFSLLLLLVGLPFFILLCIIIVLDSRGNPIYISERVGKNGKEFRLLKFRSMIHDADAKKKNIMKKNQRMDGPLFKIDNDPRVTKIGAWMRKYSIDELPNFLNVLMGNMSIIGPRPHLPAEVEKYSDDERRVLTVKPGVTGMAQVNGRHSNTFRREVELDIFYIEHWNLLLDLKIFFKTLRAMISGR